MSSHPASRVNPERQMSAHVHSAISSTDGKYVFANDLGADKVFVYRFDPKANPDLPLTPATPAFVQLPPGSGPRHLLFSADGKHAWLTMEMSAQVAVFDYRNNFQYELWSGQERIHAIETPADWKNPVSLLSLASSKLSGADMAKHKARVGAHDSVIRLWIDQGSFE